MERLEQVVALIVAAGLAVVSYQLLSPARRDDRPSREITEEVALLHQDLRYVKT